MRLERLASVMLLCIAIYSPLSAQVQLCAPDKVASLRDSLPATADSRWQDLFHDPATLFYTDAEMPPAYQMADGGLVRGGRFVPVTRDSIQTTFHWTLNNISGGYPDNMKPDGMGGNGNVEFPWKEPGGTHASPGVATFKFMRLPKRDDGRQWPVVWQREPFPGFRSGQPHAGYAWYFPHGTIFGEALGLRDSRGQIHVFEVRLRIREDGYWDVDLLRPFPKCTDLADALAALDADHFAEAIAGLRSSKQLPGLKLSDAKMDGDDQRVARRDWSFISHPRPAFVVESGMDTLPPIGEAAAVELLKLPFKSAMGETWRRGSNGIDCFAPTSNEKFSVVPQHYQASFIGTDAESCAKCHEHTTKHVDNFDPGRDWYGFVRGSRDGIFSWHPIAPQSISPNGAPRQVVFRREFVEAGIIEALDRAKHPESQYSNLKQ